jgi:hypothetical protein
VLRAHISMIEGLGLLGREREHLFTRGV